MCGGGRQRQSKQQQIMAQAIANIQAQEQQARFNQIANERQALAAQQQAEMAALEQQSINQTNAQNKEVAELQAVQAQRLGGIRSTGTSVAQSLQILAKQGAAQAPTAQVSKRSTQPGGVAQTQAKLRIGGTRQATGAGTNLSI
jgi:hypothetical protein